MGVVNWLSINSSLSSGLHLVSSPQVRCSSSVVLPAVIMIRPLVAVGALVLLAVIAEAATTYKDDYKKDDHYKEDSYKKDDHYKMDSYKDEHYKHDSYKKDSYKKDDHYKHEYKDDHYKHDSYKKQDYKHESYGDKYDDDYKHESYGDDKY